MPSPVTTIKSKNGTAPMTSPSGRVPSRGFKVLLATAVIPLLVACGVPTIQLDPAAISAAKEESWIDRYRDLLEEEAPYFGNPGERRAVWSPKELSPEALQRIGFDLSFEPLIDDARVPRVLGNLDLALLGEQERVSRTVIAIDFWPKRIPEWSEGALAPYPTPDGPELSMSNLVALSNPKKDCWLLMDTRYGALGVIVSKSYVSKMTMEQVCDLAAGAMKSYLEEFTLWLDAHPEFDPPLEAYGSRD